MTTLNVNTKNRATTQYTNFCFQSMARMGQNYLAAGADGLFLLGGPNDDGVDIDMEITLGMSDFGIEQDKKLRYVYIGLECADPVEIDVIVDEGVARTYMAKPRKAGQQTIKVPVGRDGRGRYWSFSIRNTKGGDLSIDSIKVLARVRASGVI